MDEKDFKMLGIYAKMVVTFRQNIKNVLTSVFKIQKLKNYKSGKTLKFSESYVNLIVGIKKVCGAINRSWGPEMGQTVECNEESEKVSISHVKLSVAPKNNIQEILRCPKKFESQDQKRVSMTHDYDS